MALQDNHSRMPDIRLPMAAPVLNVRANFPNPP